MEQRPGNEIMHNGKESAFTRQRVLIVIFGALTFLFMGLLYAWSIFVEPLEVEFGWTRSQTSVAYTCSMLCLYLGQGLDSILTKALSARKSLICGAVMMFLGFFVCSRTSSLFVFCLGYGVITGLGIGICYNSWQTVALSWFPDNVGIISGILKMGFGFGSFLLGAVAVKLLNAPALGGWRNTFVVLGVFMCAEVLLSQVAFKLPPEQLKKRSSVPSRNRTGVNLPPLKMLFSPSFIFYWLWKLALVGFGTAVIGQASMIAKDVGASGQMLALLSIGVLSIGNGVGRIFFGAMFDRFGRTAIMRAVSIGALTLSILFSVSYPQNIAWLVMVSLCGLGFFYGGAICLVSCYINSVFGMEHYKANASVNSFSTVPVTLIASTLIASVKTNTGSYAGFFYITLITSTISLLMTFVIPLAIKKMQQKYLPKSETESN